MAPRPEVVLQSLAPGSRAWLEQAVVISLFTDARLPDGDESPDGSDDRRGHWGDLYLEGDASLGSLLWTLRREKLTLATVNRARDMAISALTWLLATSWVSALDVSAERCADENGVPWVLALGVTLTLRDTEQFEVTSLLTGVA